MKHKSHLKRSGISAYLLIGLGIFFLIAPSLGFSFFGTLWPFLIILPGAGFLYAAHTGGKNVSGFAIPGAIITGTGAILFYQNTTGHWASWAYVWALYPVFFGLALKYMGQRTGNQNEIKVGRGFVRYGLMAFAFFAFVFELMLFNGGRLLPFLLIGAGLFLLWRGGAVDFKRRAVTFSGSHRKAYRKRKNGYFPASWLNQREEIDAALAEDDEPEPVVEV